MELPLPQEGAVQGSWLTETNPGMEKKREVGRAWLLHPC